MNHQLLIEQWQQRVYDLTVQLVRWPSITDSAGETAFAQQLHDLLAAHPYFAANPDDLWITPSSNDLHERANLFALVRGRGSQTVVLSGHYDVVDVQTYGALADLAFEPEQLLPALCADLRANARSAAEQLALRDLESGAWLPGRGVLDMKSGLAMAIAVLERFAATRGRIGNLLFVATPDEECESHGMRAATTELAALVQTRGLQVEAVINVDATTDQGDGSFGQSVFMGSAGKLLPSALLIGSPTHAGAPFDGLSANLCLAELVRQLEAQPDLSERVGDTLLPPPISLKMGDLKTQYDVTTPERAWCAFNLLSYRRAPQEVLATIAHYAEAAMHAAIATQHARAQAFTAQGDPALAPHDCQPVVLTFAELQRRAFAAGGTPATQYWNELAARLVQDTRLDIVTINCKLTEALLEWAALEGPAAIIGFASLCYPAVRHDATRPRHARLASVISAEVASLSAAMQTPISVQQVYTGISDMSFLGGAITPADATCVQHNTPAWHGRLAFDDAAAQQIDAPVINIGPWGRDYHQRTERLYLPYAWATLPELVWRVSAALLDR